MDRQEPGGDIAVRRRLTLADLVGLMEARQLVLPRRQRRAAAEALAGASVRLCADGRLQARAPASGFKWVIVGRRVW